MAITIKRIDQLPIGTITDTSPVMFGIGTSIFTSTWGDLKQNILTESGVNDLNYRLIENTNVVDKSQGDVFLSTIDLTIAAGDLVFLRVKVLKADGSLGLNTYLIPLGAGTYNPLSSALSFSDLYLLNREETTVEQTDPNTVTFTAVDLAEINASDPSLDLTDTSLIYFVELDGVLYRFTGTNGLYGANDLQMQLSDLQLVGGAETITLDDNLNTQSNNGVENNVIAKEFNRTNYDSITITSNVSTDQDFLDTNYKFLLKSVNTTVNITLGGNAPIDYNCEGVSQLDNINVSALSGFTLTAPSGTTIGQGEFFRIRRASSTIFTLEVVKDLSDLGVTSVNGQTGDVNLNADDIAETLTRKYATGNELNPGDNISELVNDEGFINSVSTNDIEAQAVSNSKLSNMNANTVKGRLSGNGTPQNVPLANLPISDDVQDALDNKVDKSSEYKSVQVSSSRNILNSDKNATLIIDGTVTLTFSGTYTSDLNFNILVKAGGSLTIANGNKTLLDGEQTTQSQIVIEEKLFATVLEFDTNEYIVLGL